MSTSVLCEGSIGLDHPEIFQVRPEIARFPVGVWAAELGIPPPTIGQRGPTATILNAEDTPMGGLGLFELLLLLFIAGALAAVTVGNRRVRDYGRDLGRGRGWEFPSEVLDELEGLRIRVDAVVDRLADVTDRLDAADIPKLPPDRDRVE
jgi:hypothetical protein